MDKLSVEDIIIILKRAIEKSKLAIISDSGCDLINLKSAEHISR